MTQSNITPDDIGKAYDTITHLWQREEFNRNNGIEVHKRASSNDAF